MTIITRDYLESLLIKDTEVSQAVKKIEESIDKELIENTQLYAKIEAFMPMYSKNFKSKYEISLSPQKMSEVQDNIKDIFKRKGFNLFLINRRQIDEFCLVITNKTSYKDMVSQPIQKGCKPIYDEGIQI